MNSSYVEVLENFSMVEAYLVTDIDIISERFYESEIKCFYDTCAIQHHSNTTPKSLLVQFLKERCGLIIVTRTVLMELAGEEHIIKQSVIEYFKEMSENGITIALLNEEDIIILLKEMLELTNEESNLLLGYAIKQIMCSRKAISNLMQNLQNGTKSKLLGPDPGDSLLYYDFFNYARQNKVSGDSLAEELMFICFIVLTKAPFGKYIFLSDDLASAGTVQDLIEYIKEHHDMECPKMLTTVKIVEKLVKEKEVLDNVTLLGILNGSYLDRVPTFCLDEYDLQVTHKTFERQELIDKIKHKEFQVIL